jgi:hypothetical protein
MRPCWAQVMAQRARSPYSHNAWARVVPHANGQHGLTGLCLAEILVFARLGPVGYFSNGPSPNYS